VIPPTLAGITNALHSAAHEASVKRFIYTSSSTAATLPRPNEVFTINSNTWNEASIAAAWAPPPYTAERIWDVYAASKTQAEQAAWEFMRERKPGFGFNAVLPDLLLGEVLDGKSASSTGQFARALYSGCLEAWEIFKHIPPRYFVNVLDAALLHVVALTNPSVQNERLFAFAEPFNWNDVLEIMRRLYPDREFPEDIECGRDLSVVDNRKAKELLRGMGREGWTGLEESVRENVVGL